VTVPAAILNGGHAATPSGPWRSERGGFEAANEEAKQVATVGAFPTVGFYRLEEPTVSTALTVATRWRATHGHIMSYEEAWPLIQSGNYHRKPAKRKPREDTSQIAYRVIQEVIKRSES
jgi:hypothetical protein